MTRGTGIERVPEWRRHFPSPHSTIHAITAPAAALAAVLLFASTALATHVLVAAILVFGGIVLAGASLHSVLCRRAGGSAPHRVDISKGRASVSALPLNQPAIGSAISTVALTLLVGSLLAADHDGVISFFTPTLRAIAWFSVVLSAAFLVFTVFDNPFNRRLVFAPDSLDCRAGLARAHIPWESLTSVERYTGERGDQGVNRGTLEGVKFTTTGQATYSGTLFPRMRGYFPIQLSFFPVDADTLYNAIVALHEHPELRPLLGTPDGAVFFEGPPREVRERMTPNQVWLPWERNIRALLAQREET